MGKIARCLTILLVLLALLNIASADPTGTSEYYYSPAAKPINGKTDVSKITQEDLARQVSHNMFSMDFTWALVAAFLVMFMQTGFALVEAGLCRKKNAHHIFLMNFLVYPIAGFAFFVLGFAVMMGGSNLFPSLNHAFGISGWNLFGLKGVLLAGASYDVGVIMLFLFQLVFMPPPVYELLPPAVLSAADATTRTHINQYIIEQAHFLKNEPCNNHRSRPCRQLSCILACKVRF